jgi:hypothetical protein
MYIIFLSKGKGFTNRYKFSHEEIKKFPKNKKVLPTNKSLAMKRWKFCKEV